MIKIKKTRQKLSLLAFRRAGGFTLFELLVTISIVAVLTAVAMVSYGGLNKKTRDSRRMADIEALRISLEEAKQVGNTYPFLLTGLVGGSYVDKMPLDPKTKAPYGYFRSSPYTYQIGSSMEDVGSTNSSIIHMGSVYCNYVLKNP